MQRSLTTRKTFTAIVAVAYCLLLLFASSAMAQSPAAGAPIGNQASATYTDASNIVRTATSNIVITQVAQVASFTLTSDNAKTATPGAQVVYTHTLTNTGNGTDSFTLTLATSGAFTHSNTAIYLDANNDGIADNTVNLAGSSVSLAAGASVHLLVTGTVPVSATSGQTGAMAVTTKSVFDGTVAAVTNTDTTTVTNNAVVNVTKSLSATSGASPSGPYTVTLTYTNNGNATATAVKLIDSLPAGMTYVATSGRWSVTGSSVTLTDATSDVQGTSPTIDYSVTGNVVTAIINSIPAAVSGTVTFQVNIATGLAPQVINNVATVEYNDGTAKVGPVNTNIASFTVSQTAAVSISDTGSAGSGDSDTTVNDVQLVASAPQGGTISFTNVVKNTGNGTDTFNISYSGSTFPVGTTFALFKSDGVTPLTDSNGDGIPDSGPVATNATYNVVIKATLPPSASGGGPYNLTVTATSTAVGAVNAGASDTVTDRLTTISASTVDLSNASPVTGTGAGPEGSAVQINTVNPGSSTIFALNVKNTAGPADSYDLLVSQTTTFTSGNNLPSGWTVTFQSSTGTDCSTLGGAITNTGVINAGNTKLVCAVINVPAGYAQGSKELYFRALSSTTNAVDVLHDAVTVNTVHSVTITPNNSGQIFPGGSVVYSHTIKNSGNVSETITFTGSFVSDNQSTWASIAYQDNGSTANSLDSTDTAVTSATSFTLSAGSSAVLLVKVTAPPAAATGAVDTTTLTATYNSGNSTANATDTSTVIAGELRLSKTQALDALCDGTADTAFTAATISSGAKPGACLIYQITATNQGSAQVTTVVVSDATPANTTYTTFGGGHAAASTKGTVTAPADGGTGTISVAVGTLDPGASATITFGVKINQ